MILKPALKRYYDWILPLNYKIKLTISELLTVHKK